MRYLPCLKNILLYVVIYCFHRVPAQGISQRRTSNTCKSTQECPMNAFCEHNTLPTEYGQCICNEGYFIVTEDRMKTCYKVANELGDFCSLHEQCQLRFTTDSECRDQHCQCKSNAHFVERDQQCYQSVKIGDYCRFTNNCVGQGTCRSGTCQCPLQTHPNWDRTVCLPDVELGEVCARDEECVAANTRCHDICRCKAGFISSQNGTKCLRIATMLGDHCETDAQCLQTIRYSHCNDAGRCGCGEGYHEINYKCFTSVNVGGICESTENCITNNTECRMNRCSCLPGLHRATDQCFSASSSHTLAPIVLFILILVTLKPN